MKSESKTTEALFDQDTGFLYYGHLLEIFLEQTLFALDTLEREGKLPPNISLGMKNFSHCAVCKIQDTHCNRHQDQIKEMRLDRFSDAPTFDCEDCKKKQSLLNVFTPATHCTDCIPVVTHTKQGICVLVKRHGQTLIMDLIPVLPSPQDARREPLMDTYRMITTSLMDEKPPGWKKAYMAYFSKDKIVPQEMHELSQIPQESPQEATAGNEEQMEKRYILVKLLGYAPEPNYQIRATQSVNAIAKFTRAKNDRLTYQYVKTLAKLLAIENLGGYMTKKLFLSHTNTFRHPSEKSIDGRDANQTLYFTLRSLEIRPYFSSRIPFDLLDPKQLFINGNIPLRRC